MRVVCDTNVLISAILYGGRPRDGLQALVDGKANGFLSPALEQEFRAVLGRRKFGLSAGEAHLICERLTELFTPVFPREGVSVIAADPADNAVLACAMEARADCIVTGDHHLLDLGQYRGIAILRPAEALERMGRTEPR